jgi:hypothetical protein
MSNWLIEIQDAGLVWVPLSNGEVKSCSSGTSSESQVIPDVTITFSADSDIPTGLLDPELNRDTARLRISDGASGRYFRIEKQPGTVSKGFNYPTITGRAYAGIITEWSAITYDFLLDVSASDMARKICTKNYKSGTGDVVGVVWLASQDPTVPGGRYQASRKSRFELLKEIVSMCGAKLRVSENGKNFEVYDAPSKSLTETATLDFDNPRSLSYELIRIKQAGNAIRVQGEQADYTRPQLPVISVSVTPTSIDADGTSTAAVSASVRDSAGNLVQHEVLVDQAITAGSYTEVPVSGCFSVEDVWLNTGTAEAPIKGAAVTPTSFTASTITVPDNANQLFIVSYTQAEIVSFSLTDQADEILGEAQTTTGDLEVETTNAIGRVIGVYRDTDINRSGVNYYTGGSFTSNTTTITLGITPGATGSSVIVDYETYNGTPLSASISPSSALCSAVGVASSVVGSGSTVGTAKITASALGQDGSAWLSLLGSSINSMELETDKAQIIAAARVEGESVVNQTNLVVHSEVYADGTIGVEGYVVTSNSIAGSVNITSGSTIHYIGRRVFAGENRLYMKNTGYLQYFTFGTSAVDVSYKTTEDVDTTAGEATITATVTQADLSPVTDGTQVDFSMTGLNDCSLSSTRVYTTSGVAETTLTAGSNLGDVYVYALAGSQRANVKVEVVNVITDDTGVGTVSYPAGSDTTDSGTEGDSGDSGEISGKRRLICDGTPHAGVTISICGGQTQQTDGGGYFSFDCGVTGSNSGTATIDGEDYPFTWTC